MEATIKETVKNIFKFNTFESALDLTRDLRGEYIREFGVKSWNGLVTYYKKLNIIPEGKAAEPENEYAPTIVEPEEEESTTDMTEEEMDAMADAIAEEEAAEETAKEGDASEVEKVEYMLYQNAGDKIDWYGHFVNYKGLKVGDEDWMIRMNNLGVGMGRVIATAQMTLPEINVFHKCYAAIRALSASDNRRVTLFKRAFNNLQEAMKDPAFATTTTNKSICDFVLNYNNKD